MATMLALRYPTKPYIYIPAFAWTLTICYGRSYFGLHYPVDLIGGMTIGVVSSVLVYSLRTQILQFLRGEGVRDTNDPVPAGVSAASFLLSPAANNFVSPVLKGYNLSFSPFTNNNSTGIGINLRW